MDNLEAFKEMEGRQLAKLQVLEKREKELDKLIKLLMRFIKKSLDQDNILLI